MRRLLLGTTLTALAAITAMGCGIPKEQHDKVLAKNKLLRQELAQLRKDKDSMQVKLTGLEADLAKVRSALKEMDGLKSALAKSRGAAAELAKLKAKMAAQKRLNERLRAQFRGLISAGALKIINVNGRLVIKMANRILFKAGRAKLSRRGRRALKKIAKVLAKIPRHFQVAGHTDNRPIKKSRFKSNWQLSAMRAVNVVNVLRKGGVPGRNISAAAFGAYQPVATNRTRIGRKLNRRIEITLLPVIPKRTH